jgi:hypothetical protein
MHPMDVEEGAQSSLEFLEIILVYWRPQLDDRQVLVVLGEATRDEDLMTDRRP